MAVEVVPRPQCPPALPHGDIEEIFPDVFFVKGSVRVGVFGFSRNMMILRDNTNKDDDGPSLTIVHSLRLSEEGMDLLDELGIVKHIIRLASFHGQDDPFYKGRYPHAQVWGLEDTLYVNEFDLNSKTTYFVPDNVMSARGDSETTLPVKDSRLIVIESSNPPEGLLLVFRPEGNILISGDALQNWATTDRFFSCLGRIMMNILGFIKPFNVGPGWYSATKPDKQELVALLDLDFDHVFPVHGDPVIGRAKQKYAPAIHNLKEHDHSSE